MEIFKILSLIFITAVLCIILREHKKEYAVMLSVVCIVMVLTLIIKGISNPLSVVKLKIESLGIDNTYIKIPLKALGIGYVTSFIAESCKDAGQSALAQGAELAGKCAIFLLSSPLVIGILQTTLGFLK